MAIDMIGIVVGNTLNGLMSGAVGGAVSSKISNYLKPSVNYNKRIGNKRNPKNIVEKNTGTVSAFLKGGYRLHEGNKNFIYIPIEISAYNMSDRQFVTQIGIVDYQSGRVLATSKQHIWDPIHKDSYWNHIGIPIDISPIIGEYRDDRVFAFELIIESEYREVLYSTRRLEKIWKPQRMRYIDNY